MMKFYADRIYLHSKVHGIKTGLLRTRDYSDIINSDRLETAFPDYIPQGGWKQDYSALKGNVFRGQIEDVLYIAEANKRYRMLFISFLRLYETENLKSIFMPMDSGKEIIWYNIYPFNTFSYRIYDSPSEEIPMKALITGIYPELIKSEDMLEEIDKLQSLDAFLTYYAYYSFIKNIPTCLFNDKVKARELLLYRFLIHKIILKHRLTINYDLSPEETKAYTFDDKKFFKKFYKLQTRIEKKIEADISSAEKKSPDEILKDLQQNYFKKISRTFYRDFHSVDTIVTYLILLSFQIRNLFYIIDAFRFNVSKKQIHQFVFSEE